MSSSGRGSDRGKSNKGDGNGKESGRPLQLSDKDKHKLPEKITIKANGVTYVSDRIVGNGSFGVVFQAMCVPSNEVVAIKKVLQDKRFKNRELQIMRLLTHPNIVQLRNSFYTNGESDELYLNLVLEFVPETVYRVARHYARVKQPVPLLYTKLYIYQLLRSLHYIHSLGICHRDIKPQNLLLDPASGILKLCDFGSAKVLVASEPNVSYICSRYYRAPELIFGATDYTTSIDIWSTGCVLGELLLGQPLFPGDSGVDQLVEIIKVLGTPTREQIQAMNHSYTEFKFPEIRPHPWAKVLGSSVSQDAIDLLTKLLRYTPFRRLKPLESLTHPFFDEIRDQNTRLPNGNALPPLFNFSVQELQGVPASLVARLIPPHARAGYESYFPASETTTTTTTTTSNTAGEPASTSTSTPTTSTTSSTTQQPSSTTTTASADVPSTTAAEPPSQSD